MLRFLISRLMQAFVVILLMTVLVFLASRLSADPLYTMLPYDATEELRASLSQKLGLDKPLYIQYWIWVKSIAKGDLGNSVTSPYPVFDLIKSFTPNTIKLAILGMIFGLAVGVPLGVLAGAKRGQLPDFLARTVAVFFQSAPLFWVALILLYFLSIKWHLFPILDSTGLWSAILPSISLSLFMVAGITRLTRSSMIDAMDSDYITLARIKGLSEKVVIFKHALKNALIPVVTYTGMWFAIILSGVVVIEVVFSWPGLGLLTFKAALSGDYPVIQGTVVLITAAVVIINFIVDIVYAIIDPRIRYRKS